MDGLTASGVVLGTADYIAPEQIGTAQEADARADVYGLGATLYFLLAGVPPFAGDRPRSWLDKLLAHQTEPAPPVRGRRPDVPAALSDLVERMMAKVPADRPTTAGEVAAALRPFATGADLVRLLTSVDETRVAPRPVAGPTNARPPKRPLNAAGRYALAAAAGAVLTFLIALPFLGPRGGKVDLPTVPTGTGSGAWPEAEPPEGVHMTFGPYGPPRGDHKVLPGETVALGYVVRGLGTDPAGEVSYTIAGELVDPTGKKWVELAPSPNKGPLYLGGSTTRGWVSYDLAAAQPPGEYKARARLTDRVTGRVVAFEHPVYVLRPEFGAVRLRLTHDGPGAWPTGCHITVGQQFHVQGRAVGYVRKGGRIHVTINVSARDRDGKETTAEPLKPFRINQEVGDDFIYFNYSFGPLRTVMAGEATITLEMKDVLADRAAKYDLPVVIHPPRSLLTPVTGR